MQGRHFSSGTPEYILSDYRHVPLPTPKVGIVEDLSSSQKPFAMQDEMMVLVKGKKSFLAEIETDKERMRSEHQDHLNSLFSSLESELNVRCLISPYSLCEEKDIRRLCHAYGETLGKVIHILTAYDFADNYAGMPRSFRRTFLDFLCEEHVLITPDWFSLGTSFTHNLSDTRLWLPRHKRESDDDTSQLEPRFKGESDTSYKVIKGTDGKEIIKASIAIIIWKDDEILWSEIIEDVCEGGGGSVEAEALAMDLLLKRAIQIGISQIVASIEL